MEVEEIKKNPRSIARLIDHTIVKPIATSKDVKRYCREAKKYGFYSVVTLPYYIKLANKLLKNTSVKLGCVIGFPWGVQSIGAKIKEVEEVLDLVDEFDMVMNRAAFKNKDYGYVVKEIKSIKKIIGNKILKVIIETPELSERGIKKASELVLKGGADFVKTAVGLRGPTLVKHVKIIRSVVGDKILIKASGGIRDFNTALKMIEAGASRLGCSQSLLLLKKHNK